MFHMYHLCIMSQKMKWINIKDKKPKEGNLIIVWLAKAEEPSCVRVEGDKHGLLFVELVEVSRHCNREDLVSHWFPIKPPSEEDKK